MQFIEDFVNKNPEKYNTFIQRINKYESGRKIDLEMHFLLYLVYNYIVGHENLLDTIHPNQRITFIEQCSKINRQFFFYSLKTGMEVTELARNQEGIISFISMEQEIEIIDTYLSNNGSKKVYKALDGFVYRGFMHAFNELGEFDEHELSEIINNSVSQDDAQNMSFAELKREMFSFINYYKGTFSSEMAKQGLFYFNDAIPVDDLDYTCFYKPFFLALQDYKDYLNELIEKKKSKYAASSIKFSPIEKDFRGVYGGQLSYDDIKDVKKFKYLEEKLFEDNIINKDYTVQKIKGNKNNLAAIYKFMIREGYFAKINYKRRDNFKEYHYRQYLDHRYDVDTTQQFKKITDEQVKTFLQSKQYRYNFKILVNTNYYSL